MKNRDASQDLLIKLDGISKSYPKLATPKDRVRALWNVVRRKPLSYSHTILDDISFMVRRGESLGIIGENGAGKSTLLKIIAKVVQPTFGHLFIRGRIGALLELGAGFHPEYSGRVNIGIAARLMGLNTDEVKAKTSSIIEFAEIGDYIDEPIKHYSSGMVVRLGFAIVTALHADVLITDEVLAVGDESFQKKCVSWLESFLSNGGTLLLCSHSMYHIQKLCVNACWVHNGKIRAKGDSYDVTAEYLAYHEAKFKKDNLTVELHKAGHYKIILVRFGGVTEEQSNPVYAMGDELQVYVKIYSPDGRSPSVTVGLVRADGSPIYGVTSDYDGVVAVPFGVNEFGFSLVFPKLSLLPGAYVLRAHAMDPEALRLFDTVELPFRVRGQSREFGLCRLDHRWSSDKQKLIDALRTDTPNSTQDTAVSLT